MENAVGYIRVSTDEQARGGVSLAAQEEKILAYCAQLGLKPLKVIREEEFSETNNLAERAGGRELVALVSGKRVNHIVALKLDRLFRDAADALDQTREWDKAGVAMHLVDMGGQIPNTAMGRFFLTSMAAIAELERNLISERTKTAMAHKKAHRKAYGPTPFGYDRVGDDLKKNPLEYYTLKKISKWRAEGWSLGKIPSEFNRLKVPTKKGGAWYPGTVKYLLENTLYGHLP